MNLISLFLLVLVTIFWKSEVSSGKILPLTGHMYDCGRPAVVADPKMSKRSKDHKNARIIGGEPVDVISWPWAALLAGHIKDDPNTIFVCSATLLSNQWLITASRCFEFEDLLRSTISLGITKTFADRTPDKELEIEKVIKNATGLISLVKLKKPVRFSDTIRPICLSDVDLAKVNENVVQTGWGVIKTDPVQWPEGLNQAKLPIVENKECNAQSFQMCAGVVGPNPKGGCGGDMGNPLVLRKDGRFYLAGVVSSIPSGCIGFTTNARTWSFNSWIQDVIRNN